MASTLRAMAFMLVVMTSTLRATASNLKAMTSTLRAMASTLVAMASNALHPSSDGFQPKSECCLHPESDGLVAMVSFWHCDEFHQILSATCASLVQRDPQG